ncbi:MAG: hypothetical protein K2X47_02385, partial [Bdellovibrionales bacterium]|nr:hypothetical protein [Bdellovibrionales bacterium]
MKNLFLLLPLFSSVALSQERLFRCEDNGGYLEISTNPSGAVKVSSYINGIVEIGQNPASYIGTLQLKKEASRCVISLRTKIGNRTFILEGKNLSMQMDEPKPVDCTIPEAAKANILRC